MSQTIPVGAKIGAGIAAALVALYVALSVFMVLPASAAKAAVSPVLQVASPYFAQKWDVFAPTVLKNNQKLQVQVMWRDAAGKPVKSEWLDVTGIEESSIPGNPLPSRISKVSWNLIKTYYTRYLQLTPEQRATVKDTFIKRVDGGFGAIPNAVLADKLLQQGDSILNVNRILRSDGIVKEYLTYFTTAYYDQDIERMRWRLYQSRPNDFDHRLDAKEQFKPQTTTFGWRQVTDKVDPKALAAFRDVTERYGSR